MREIHHRVKNNLQVIHQSLLNMQQRALTDPAARAAMSDTRQRITALALIYRALYQSPDLRRVDVRQFLEELIAQLHHGRGRQAVARPSAPSCVADDLEIDPDKLAPLALFAVEALTQARKARPRRAARAHHRALPPSPPDVTLEIEDDGPVGALAPASTAGVGRTLMTAYARQLRGRSEVEAAPNQGMAARLIFPAPEPEPPPPDHDVHRPLRGNQAAA